MIKHTLLFFLLQLLVCSIYAQQQKDTIKTEKLIIVKQYSPTLNDAFKVKSKPVIKDSVSNNQKEISYTIFSVPVASTFTPLKGKAGGIKRNTLPSNYQNYARLGVGNYTNILGQFFGNYDINPNQNIEVDFNHLSSAGGIDGEILDNDFVDTGLNLKFNAYENQLNWNAGVGVDYKRYNWYGIDETKINNINQLFGSLVSDIDPLQTYLGFSVGGGIDFQETFIKNINLKYQNFSDDYSSSENHLRLNSNLFFNIGENPLQVDLDLDYLSGSFKRQYNNSDFGIDYSYFTTSLHPSYQFSKDKFTIDLGLKTSILNDVEVSETDFFVFPKINATYRYTDDMLFYTGIDGGLIQNSYQTFVEQNPFVSPTLFIQPTENTYNAFAGLRGNFKTFSYNFKAFYSQENNYAFFVENPSLAGIGQFTAQANYEFSNSFGVEYDNLSTLSFLAEINYNAIKNLILGLSAQYFNFSTDDLPEASYLPNLKFHLNSSYKIGEKISLQSTLFYVGERESIIYQFLPVDGIGFGSLSVDGFVDFNLGVDYQLTEKLGVFVRGNNLLNNNYQEWRNLDVQGIQVMGGLSYQFDW